MTQQKEETVQQKSKKSKAGKQQRMQAFTSWLLDWQRVNPPKNKNDYYKISV